MVGGMLLVAAVLVVKGDMGLPAVGLATELEEIDGVVSCLGVVSPLFAAGLTTVVLIGVELNDSDDALMLPPVFLLLLAVTFKPATLLIVEKSKFNVGALVGITFCVGCTEG